MRRASICQIFTPFSDGEGLFYVAEIYSRLGRLDRAERMLQRAIDGGFTCRAAFENDVYLAPLRETPAWSSLVDRGKARSALVIDRFVAEDGRTLLGLP